MRSGYVRVSEKRTIEMLLPNVESLSKTLTNLRVESEKQIVSGSVDDVLKEGFWLVNPQLSASKKAALQEVEVAARLVKSIEARTFWSRLWLRKEYSQALERQRDVASKRSKQVEVEEAELRKYELANRLGAVKKVEQSDRSSNHLREIRRLEKKLSDMVPVYTEAILQHGNTALGFEYQEPLLPSGPMQLDLVYVTQQLGDLEEFARRELPKRVAQASISKKALEIHSEFLAVNCANDVSGSDSSAYAHASAEGITRQLKPAATPTATDPQDRLQAAFRAAVMPGSFVRPDAWITFWTAIKATTDYHAKAYGAGYAEDAFAIDWCNAWEQQIRAWGPDLCAALGLPDGYVHAVRGTFLNKKAETRTGADIMLALCTKFGDSVRVRLAFIQFKRDERKTDRIDVWQNGVRQFQCLEKLHRPDLGSFSMHALLSVRNSGLASIPAVEILKSKAAINRSYGFTEKTSATTWTATGCDVDWRDCGESFPTLLTGALCGKATASFDGVQAAFKWLSDNSGLKSTELPPYMIFQAIGENARALTKSMELEGQRWAKVLGLSIDSPSRGMSFGR
ncbi:hypothetical protein SAMN06265784_103709 [Paraburkholderia susongensis]|uniref:Uncharacterized protein n=1 Tax=Paraburkholderia susongensis TaxID=1515439 RepID=A0A1X7KER5_9BURK|nr:hypothetical protein SAMN06265784_103709 [Paraburkholderia susongensis]